MFSSFDLYERRYNVYTLCTLVSTCPRLVSSIFVPNVSWLRRPVSIFHQISSFAKASVSLRISAVLRNSKTQFGAERVNQAARQRTFSRRKKPRGAWLLSLAETYTCIHVHIRNRDASSALAPSQRVIPRGNKDHSTRRTPPRTFRSVEPRRLPRPATPFVHGKKLRPVRVWKRSN